MEGFDRPRAAFAPLRRHHVGLRPSPRLAPACDPPLFYYSIQLRIGFSSAMAAFSMQKDQRLLPALRHLGDSESTNQNADTTGSTLNAFHLSISSDSAPIFLAHYSLTNQNLNALSSERHMSSYSLYIPTHPRRIHRLHMLRPMVMLLKPKRTNWGARDGVFGTWITLLGIVWCNTCQP
jgi:hypothetical protein